MARKATKDAPMVRLTPKIVRQLDARAKYLTGKMGYPVSRTRVAQMLLLEMLEKKS